MADQGVVAILEQRAQARSDQDPLAVGIVQAGTSLKFATLALRSCYVANAASIEEFTTFRADVTTKAAVYKEKVLPLAKLSLQKVKDFVIYFQDLSYEDCLDIAGDIAADAKNNQELMELNRDTHKAMTVEFNMLADKVETVLKKCELEAEQHHKNMESLQSSASTKQKWAVGLAFIPFVGAIAAPLLAHSAQNNQIEAIAEGEEAKIAVGAATVVEGKNQGKKRNPKKQWLGLRAGTKPGDYVTAGTLICKQNGLRWKPGTNVSLGGANELFATKSGYVHWRGGFEIIGKHVVEQPDWRKPGRLGGGIISIIPEEYVEKKCMIVDFEDFSGKEILPTKWEPWMKARTPYLKELQAEWLETEEGKAWQEKKAATKAKQQEFREKAIAKKTAA